MKGNPATVVAVSFFRRLFSCILQAWLALLAVGFVSMVMAASSALSGPYSMDITFDLSPGSLHFHEVEWSDSGNGLDIRCNDETFAFADGVRWVRCRFVADETIDAQRYLHKLGLKTGSALRNIRISPVGGGQVFYAVSLIIAVLLVALLMWSRHWSPSLDLGNVRALRGRSLAIVVMPALVTFAVILLLHMMIGGDESQSPLQPFSVAERCTVLITAVLVAPLIEELLYRGLIFGLLERVGGGLQASVFGTGLFVACHASMEFWDIRFTRLAMLTVLSACLYVVRMRWESLILCVIAHMVFNASVVFVWMAAAG